MNMIFFGSFSLTFSVNPPAPKTTASTQSAFPTVLCSVLVANFTGSTCELEDSPGSGMWMERFYGSQAPGGILQVHCAVRLRDVQTERRGRSLSLPLSSSSPIRLHSFPLSFQRITLSAHTLGCKLIEHKPNTCHKCPMDGLSSHSQLPLILGHRFPTEKNAIICI